MEGIRGCFKRSGKARITRGRTNGKSWGMTYFNRRSNEVASAKIGRLTALVLLPMLLAACSSIRPEPLTITQISEYAQEKAVESVADQEPVAAPIGLYEAMARALKYNLDFRVEVAAKVLKARQLDVASHKGLPDLVSSLDYAGRNNFSGGRSRSLLSGVESLEPSTSSDRNVLNADLKFSWNILDFGLSYARAKQAADEVLVAEELKRKIVNKIIEDVRTAYWRALGAQRIVTRLTALQRRVAGALADSERLLNSGETEPLTELTYQRELAQIELELKKLNAELRISKAQLAALINLPPNTEFTLANVRQPHNELKLKGDLPEMILTAFENRPEIRESIYKSRINKREADVALLELLPGLQVFAGPNWNTNEFLFNNNWVGWGAKASWNLMKAFTYPAQKRQLEAQTKLLNQQALALSMAVMTQVHVSRLRHYHAHDAYHSTRKINRIQRRILRQLKLSERAGATSEQTLIREEMNTIVSDVRLDIAYATLQGAYASAQSAMGLDVYDNSEAIDDDVFRDKSVDELAAELKKVWRDR